MVFLYIYFAYVLWMYAFLCFFGTNNVALYLFITSLCYRAMEKNCILVFFFCKSALSKRILNIYNLVRIQCFPCTLCIRDLKEVYRLRRNSKLTFCKQIYPHIDLIQTLHWLFNNGLWMPVTAVSQCNEEFIYFFIFIYFINNCAITFLTYFWKSTWTCNSFRRNKIG